MTTPMSCSISRMEQAGASTAPSRMWCSRVANSSLSRGLSPAAGLVEAQQHRAGAHGAGDLQPALGAVGAGRPPGRRRGRSGRSRRASAGRGRWRRPRPGGGRRCRTRPAAPGRTLGISALCWATSRFSSTVMPANRRMFWNVRATRARRAIRWPGRRLQVVRAAIGMDQAQLAGGRAVEPGDAVKHRRLARAVGADDGGDVAAPCCEGQVRHGRQAAEPHDQILDRQQRVAVSHGPAPPVSAAISCRSPSATVGVRPDTRPRGRKTIIATSAKPKISMR